MNPYTLLELYPQSPIGLWASRQPDLPDPHDPETRARYRRTLPAHSAVPRGLPKVITPGYVRNYVARLALVSPQRRHAAALIAQGRPADALRTLVDAGDASPEHLKRYQDDALT